MTAPIETKPAPRTSAGPRPGSHVRGRFRAPFALRCGAWLIDYILIALPVSLSTFVARLMGGGARMAGGTSEKAGIILTVIIAVLDLGVLAGLRGQTVGKWITGLRIELMDGRLPGIGRALLRHFIGYPLSLLPLGLGFLMITVSPRGRSLHDLIAGTVVVREYLRSPQLRPRTSRAPRAQA